MAQQQDLYTAWLGIPPGLRPPDHYVLLGVPRFTQDAKAIDAAARRRLAALDRYAIHPDAARREACTRMMNEVAAARITLLDPARRVAYDLELKARLGAAGPDAGLLAEMLPLEGPAKPPAAGPPPQTPPRGGERQSRPQSPARPPAGGGELPELGPMPREPAPLTDARAVEEAEVEELDQMGRSMAAPARPDQAQPAGRPVNVLTVISAAAGALLLVAGLAWWLLSMDSAPVAPPAPAAPAAPSPQAAAPPPPPVVADGATLVEEFESEQLGRSFTVSGLSGPPLVEQGWLVLEPENQTPVRVELTPQPARPFHKASARVALDAGAQLSFGIRTASRLTLTRSGDQLLVRAQPGSPATETGAWPTLSYRDAALDGGLRVQLTRDRGQVLWTVNDQPVAFSSEIRTMGDPGVVIECAGEPGSRARVDYLRLWQR